MARPRNPRLYVLRYEEPDAARLMIRGALSECGSVAGAAKRLGVGRATLFRWLQEDPSICEGVARSKAGNPLWKRKVSAICMEDGAEAESVVVTPKT